VNTVELVGARPTERIERFLAEERPDTPFVVIDLDVVRERYLSLAGALPDVHLHYAVKANPAASVLELLAVLGSSFDVASPAELDACLRAGADPARISYGNTVKKREWIADAWEKGVRVFTVDSEGELEKIVAEAPGSTVACRLLTNGAGADWPLSRKFGCEGDVALRLLFEAAEAGLGVGVSFHVGSQQRDVHAWEQPLRRVSQLFAQLRSTGIEPQLVNIGGGFPGQYVDDIPPVEAYGDAITDALHRCLGPDLPRIIAEPGRSLVADAGLLQTEVILAARKADHSVERWVYLDVGLFGGLAETLGEAIRYRIRTPHDGGSTGPVVLAGPTCDSADVLYEDHRYELPLALAPGDRVELLSTGAYTTTYSAVGFNGFAPLTAYYLGATEP
jgi:ornithine decarboxylase